MARVNTVSNLYFIGVLSCIPQYDSRRPLLIIVRLEWHYYMSLFPPEIERKLYVKSLIDAKLQVIAYSGVHKNHDNIRWTDYVSNNLCRFFEHLFEYNAMHLSVREVCTIDLHCNLSPRLFHALSENLYVAKRVNPYNIRLHLTKLRVAGQRKPSRKLHNCSRKWCLNTLGNWQDTITQFALTQKGCSCSNLHKVVSNTSVSCWKNDKRLGSA